MTTATGEPRTENTIGIKELHNLLAVIKSIIGRDPSLTEMAELLKLISQMQGDPAP